MARRWTCLNLKTTNTTTPQRSILRRAVLRSSMISKRSAGLPFDEGVTSPGPQSGAEFGCIRSFATSSFCRGSRPRSASYTPDLTKFLDHRAPPARGLEPTGTTR